MKKISLILAAAVAALAFTSCNNREMDAPENAGPKTKIIVSGEMPEVEEATKTYLAETDDPANPYSIFWGAAEAESLNLLLGDLSTSPEPVVLPAKQPYGDKTMTFYGEVPALTDGNYDALLFYPSAMFKGYHTDGSLKFNLKQEQLVNGNYDDECDFLVWSGKDIPVSQNEMLLDKVAFNRQFAFLRINLLADEGSRAYEETVRTFEINVDPRNEAKANVRLTGNFYTNSSGEIIGWDDSDSFKERVIATPRGVQIGKPGENTIYLIVNAATIPAGCPIWFTVITENYNSSVWICRISPAPEGGMTFEPGKVNTINLKLRDKDFSDYVEPEEDFSGEWLITGASGDNIYAANAYDTGNNLKASTLLTINDESGAISSVDDLDNCRMTFTKVTDGDYAGMYTIQDANNKYLYAAAASSNNLKGQASPDEHSYWTVTKEGDEYSIVASKSNRRNIMRFNYNSGSPIVSCYEPDKQSPVTLYPFSKVVVAPKITFPETTKEISSSAANVVFSYTKSSSVTELPTYTFYSGWDCVDGEVTVTGESITVPVSANTHSSQRLIYLDVSGQGIEGTVRLGIKQAAYAPPVTISTILADATITSSNAVNYEIDGVTVMAAQGRNYIIADATGLMVLYAPSGTTLTVGKQYKVKGDVKLYNGVHEFTGTMTITESTGTAPAAGTPEEMTVASLTAYASAPVAKYAVVYATAGDSGYLCSDGTNTINVYDSTGTWSQFYGKDVKVTGYLFGFYSSKINMIATAIEDVTNPDTPKLSVNPTSLTWAADKYGLSEAKAIAVTVNSNATGYTVSGSSSDWTVSDNGSGTVTVYPNAANTSTTADKTLTLTITHKDAAGVSKQVTLTQSKASPSGGDSYTLDSAAIKAAHAISWNYTSGINAITALDGSVWTSNNTYGNKDQVTIQMNTGKGCYIASPDVGTKKITKVTVELTNKADGTGTGTRALNILDGAGKSIASSVAASSLISGYSISGDYAQIRLEPAEGAVYLKSIKIDFE